MQTPDLLKQIVETYLLHLLLIPFLQPSDVIRSLLSLLNLLPCLHFLLLQQSDTIGQQLGISLNAINKNIGKNKLMKKLKSILWVMNVSSE